MPRLVAAPDKFRGTATGREVADTIAAAARAQGWLADPLPVSDGGEGLLDCFGGPNRSTEVSGPLGVPVTAGWRLDGARAVIEMATASGLLLAGPSPDPLAAHTRGTGELIRAAVQAGATLIVVGAGGSASTDGGLGAVEVLRELPRFGGRVELIVATDVRTRFVAAAEVFGPQKGADPDQLVVLTERLRALAGRYRVEFGIDVDEVPGSGAAGGLAGGLVALGATIRPGFGYVAEQLGLADLVRGADLVVTGEGRFDTTSLDGKAVGGVAAIAAAAGVPVAVIAGQLGADPARLGARLTAVDLSAEFGAERARGATLECVAAAVTEILATR